MNRRKKLAMIGLRLCPVAVCILLPVGAFAQLPDGPGKQETQKLCTQCHELERALSPRQDHDAWQATINKMVNLGLRGSDDDIRLVTDYLAKAFPGEPIPKLNVNTATAIQFESALSLKRSESTAVIEYRTKNGAFKSLDDLKNIPGVPFAKFEAKKLRLAF
jgi:competence protein ComEA